VTEGDSAESPARGVDVLVINLVLEGAFHPAKEQEEDLAKELWDEPRGGATKVQEEHGEVVNRVWQDGCLQDFARKK
jgi:hypothetical protein